MMLEDPYVEAALQALPSPDYVSGPEYPPSPVYEPYVPEPVYPEFMPPEEDALPAEEQPLPATISPTTDSPGYITKSDPEEDPEEEDEDPKEDPADYLDDRDDDDDEEEESSRDNVDDEEDEEEEEHLALADFVLPHILSPLLPVSPPLLPVSPTYPLGYRAAMIRLRAETPSTFYPLPLSTSPSGTPPFLPIPLHTSSPHLVLPSNDCRAGVSEVTLPPQKRLCIALSLRYKVSESSSAPTARPTGGFRANYGFVGTLDDEIRLDPKREVGYRITDTWDDMVEDI
ncbi:hypothetical protein Tco_0030456 [Tanacetum coccineum]